MHAQMWLERLAGRPARRRRALAVRVGGSRSSRLARRSASACEVEPSSAASIPSWRALGRDDDGASQRPGGDVVTAEAVWEALAEIPDPEIPVISLVDLGVVRDVAVEDGTRARRVHADLPRLPGARGDARRDGREHPRARRRARRRGDPRRLVVDRPDHARGPREAPRRRASRRPRRARRRPRARPAAVHGVQCPYCGSTETTPREHLRPDAVPVGPLLRRAAASRSSSSRRSSPLE